MAPSNQPVDAFLAKDRRRHIIEMVEAESRVTVSDLSDRFNVSSVTIRTDLRELESEGLLRRVRGGAIRREGSPAGAPAAADGDQVDARVSIARRASALVRDGDTFFCDSGLSMLEFVRCLSDRKNLTIITPDLRVASCAENVIKSCTILLCGGTVRQGFHYLVGGTAVRFIREHSAPRGYFSTTAFSFEQGLTVQTDANAELKRAMLERSGEHVLLMDSSKIGHHTTCRYADMGDMTLLVTDDGIASSDRRRLERMSDGPQILIAKGTGARGKG